ncbi:MAG: SDR family oxidoreductase [Chitinispirillales bacterium]|jgi:3-oxoacyl-[acyl-carrier protein] reductase|nr:SDR family oxidoreductase [Chitinispirillales bacterium]
MKIDLNGKLALITGASGGIGRTVAKTCALCGADVALHYYKDKDSVQKVADDIRNIGRKAKIFQANITCAQEINTMKDAVYATMGTPQIIVNNAVIQYEWKNILEQDLKDYESQFQSCIMHNVHMIKAFVPEMVKNKYGRVIAMNTECAMELQETQSAYVAGKRGMDGLLKVLAREVGEFGITVNQVAPGWTITEKFNGDLPEGADEYITQIPLKRMGTDQDIANAVVFLACDLASFITGAYIPVCGGNVMPTI